MGEKLCDCHGQPMLWATDLRYRAGGYWRCRARDRAAERARYAKLEGVRYQRLLLRHRRDKALARMASRHESTEGD